MTDGAHPAAAPGPAGHRHVGRPASPGRVEGPLIVYVAKAASAGRPTASPLGWPDLHGAIIRASAGLQRLHAGLGDAEAADVLDFQIEVLADPTLVEAVRDRIDAGADAGEAWHAAMDAEIDGLLSAPDGHFRARASDLVDLRDRVLAELRDEPHPQLALPASAIVVARDLAPSRFLEINWGPGHGLALTEGSPSAHLAILARTRGLPVVVNLGAVDARPGSVGLLDGDAGELLIDPSEADRTALESRRARAGLRATAAGSPDPGPALTASGERVEILININSPDELDRLDPADCDGIGLVRTEFLFASSRDGGSFPGEAVQYEAYRRILAWAAGRRVVIRTLDAGGDKPIAGYTIDGESNPFLGLRGVRLSLARPEPFRAQLRALLRAAAFGPLDIMVPMVAVPDEMARVRAVLDEAAGELAASGVAFGRPRLGMMVEVPAAALTLDRFPVDFASIGSNDLAQYTMAVGRDAGALSAMADIAQPAVLELIRRAVVDAGRVGLPIGLCGDAAGDTRLLPDLLAAGLRSLSMTPRSVPAVREAIATLGLGGVR